MRLLYHCFLSCKVQNAVKQGKKFVKWPKESNSMLSQYDSVTQFFPLRLEMPWVGYHGWFDSGAALVAALCYWNQWTDFVPWDCSPFAWFEACVFHGWYLAFYFPQLFDLPAKKDNKLRWRIRWITIHQTLAISSNDC